MIYFSGPEEEPSLHIDIDDFFKALEAQSEDLSIYSNATDKDMLRWNILLKTKWGLDGYVWTKQPMMIMMDGQGDDEFAFTVWLRSDLPREQILVMWSEDGSEMGRITPQASVAEIKAIFGS